MAEEFNLSHKTSHDTSQGIPPYMQIAYEHRLTPMEKLLGHLIQFAGLRPLINEMYRDDGTPTMSSQHPTTDI